MSELRLCKKDEDDIQDALKNFLEAIMESGILGKSYVEIEPEGKICLKAFVDENSIINMDMRYEGDYFARWYDDGKMTETAG